MRIGRACELDGEPPDDPKVSICPDEIELARRMAVHEVARRISRCDDHVVTVRRDLESPELPGDVSSRPRRVRDEDHLAAVFAVSAERIERRWKALDSVMDNPPDIAEPDRIALRKIPHQAAAPSETCAPTSVFTRRGGEKADPLPSCAQALP